MKEFQDRKGLKLSLVFKMDVGVNFEDKLNDLEDEIAQIKEGFGVLRREGDLFVLSFYKYCFEFCNKSGIVELSESQVEFFFLFFKFL